MKPTVEIPKQQTDCDYFGAQIAETLKLLPRASQMRLKVKILELCIQFEQGRDNVVA